MEETSTFLRAILGNQPNSYAWLAVKNPITGKVEALPTPIAALESAMGWVDRNRKANHDVYFCVNTTTSKLGRREEFVTESNVVYADLDDKVHWKDLLVEPSYVTETSPGKYQAFWIMQQRLPAFITSDISRRIAHHHHLDACFDVVRLMRYPTSKNFKRVWVGDHTVRIIHKRPALFRHYDFEPYPKVPFKYIESNQGEIVTTDVKDIPKYEELDQTEKDRIDRYMVSAIEGELMKLAELASLKPGQTMEYSGRRGIEEYGWDRGCMWVSRCLVELANAPWNNYTLEQAKTDFMTNAPTDMNWTKNDLYDKWQSALNKNCRYGLRFRQYPTNGD